VLGKSLLSFAAYRKRTFINVVIGDVISDAVYFIINGDSSLTLTRYGGTVLFVYITSRSLHISTPHFHTV